jgi:hypothetical protein
MQVLTDIIVSQRSAPIVPAQRYDVASALIVVALIALRIVLVSSKPFGLDEAGLAAAINAASPDAVLHGGIAPNLCSPLALALLYFASHGFGLAGTALRLPSLLCDIAAIGLCFFGLRSLIGPRPAMVAAIVLAAAPNAIFYAADVSPHSLALLLSTTTVILALRLGFSRSGKILLAFTATAIALAFDHPFGFILGLGLYGWLIWHNRADLRLLALSALCFVASVMPFAWFELQTPLATSFGAIPISAHNIAERTQIALTASWGNPLDLRAVGLELIVPVLAAMAAKHIDRRFAGCAGELLVMTLAGLAAVVVLFAHSPLFTAANFLVFTPLAAVVSAFYVALLGRLVCFFMILAMPVLVTLPWLMSPRERAPIGAIGAANLAQSAAIRSVSPLKPGASIAAKAALDKLPEAPL